MSPEFLERDGTRLALHGWPSSEPVCALFYVHGTQSHAGWLLETGPKLAQSGVAVWALDRRGSGQSGGVRGDATSFREWLDDYRAALALVRDRHPELPLTILGQSLGGCIATALAVEAPEMHEALLLSGPAFDLLLGKVPQEKIEKIRRERPAAHFPVKVTDDQYTRDPAMLEFMRGDEKMARALTGRFLAAQIDLEEHVRGLPPGAFTRPAALITARQDPIVSVPLVRERFRALAPAGPIVELPCDEHYLEFTAARAEWRDRVSAFARSGGSSIEP